MRFTYTISAAALLSLAAALPSVSGMTLHERREVMPSQWTKRSRLAADFPMPVRVGLKQRNLEEGETHLYDVSDPASPNYGKHWTPKQVLDFFSPSEESISLVKEWLIESGIEPSSLRLSHSNGWLEFEAPASQVESLLNTEYFMYDHQTKDRSHVACSDYHVPSHLSSHIDLITPTIHFDTRPEKPSDRGLIRKRSLEARKMSGAPSPGKIIDDIVAVVEGLTTCDAVITPPCLRALYDLPAGGTTANHSSFGIVEYAPETYLQTDLDEFWATPATNDAGVPVGTAPKYVGIDGGYLAPLTDAGFDINGEPDLDLQYGMDLVYPQTVTLYQVGDNGTNSEDISFNNFLDAIDGSYCTYEGGDDPSVDETFPDPGGYQGTENCGTAARTSVISTSYAYNEHDLTPSYEMRQCSEYMKLGLLGTSFLFSSGDYGVAGNSGQCIAANGSYNDGGSGRFNPSFPGTCPYITSVGATQIPIGGSVTTPETACETVIYSGGGFSNVFPEPSYQKAALTHYYKNNPNPYTSAQNNNSKTTRGFPDVAANGANYIVALDGTFELVYGTSASAPVFASVVTLINERRKGLGKSPLGFLNPAFYAHPKMFNDITSGGNEGCGTAGYNATVGWDPVTGLGTPNFTKMIKVLAAA